MAIAATMALLPAAGQAAGEPQLTLEPGGHDFGLQPIYDTAQTTFALRDEGAEQAWVESIEIVDSGSGSFWVGSSNCWSGPVQPAEACSIDVYFNPGDVSEYAAQLRVTAGGIQFEAELGGTGASPYFTSEPNPVDFGSAAVGEDGATREIEVLNAGNWPGGLFIAVISGGAVGSYQLLDENCTNRLIAPAEACTAQVRFRPIAAGTKRATLSLFGESDGGSQIVLTGIGKAAKPEPASAAIAPPAPAGTAAAAIGAAAVARRLQRAKLRIRKLRRRARLRRIRQRRAQRLRLQRRSARRWRRLRGGKRQPRARVATARRIAIEG